MRINAAKFYQYLINKLNLLIVKYDVHSFDSGAIMVDIWHNNAFYVIQIDTNSIGFSKIDDTNPGFDNIPDELFYDNEMAMKKLDSILTT